MKKILLEFAIINAAFIAIGFIPAPVRAVEINVTKPMVQIDGSAFKDKDGKPVSITLRSVVTNSLLGVYSDEPALSGEDKTARWLLALRIQHEVNPDLTAEEVALIKKLVAKNYPTGVAGQAWIALDSAASRAKEKPQR
jgi:hypothetical protein